MSWPARALRHGARMVRRWWWVLLIAALLGGYWLLPISGQVIVMPGEGSRSLLWPQMRLDPPSPRPGQQATLWVVDAVPWVHVALTVDGETTYPEQWPSGDDDRLTWKWTFTVPEGGESQIVFYRDCHTGCIERGRLVLGSALHAGRVPSPPLGAHGLVPTKLGAVFANPERDWHGRSGWDVELTYACLADEPFWGIDDLAARVHEAEGAGLRVLVRVDYDQGQSIPPAGDHVALSEYLAYLRRLARDERLRGVHGYLLGSGYNSLEGNALDPERPVTPEWYARLFNGYGEPVLHSDNAVQTIRTENSHVRVLVGPLRPWSLDQGGDRSFEIDVPWLNYMHALVAYLDEAARTKALASISSAAPDGFALHVPGRPGAPELMGHPRSEEPHTDLRRDEWDGAQAGFRIYQDWLAVVNAYPSTQGLPAYITSSNTYVPGEDVPPAQSYPEGWLTSALTEVEAVPQIQSLCWFLDEDRSGDARWDWFSLTRRSGRLTYAAEEFDALLRE